MGSIKLLKQNDYNGCGIACVAMITKKSYNDVKEELIKAQKKKTGRKSNITRATDLNPLLNKLGYKSEIKKSGSWDDISGTSIVGVNRGDGVFHWVIAIKDSKRFLIIDPKNGEVLNGRKKIKKKRYKHGVGKSNYISINTKVNSISI